MYKKILLDIKILVSSYLFHSKKLGYLLQFLCYKHFKMKNFGNMAVKNTPTPLAPGWGYWIFFQKKMRNVILEKVTKNGDNQIKNNKNGSIKPKKGGISHAASCDIAL